MNTTKDYYNAVYKIILSPSIPRIFDDFLISTGIKHYDHTSAIHTSLLYEYCLGKALSHGYTLKEYSVIMDRMTRYAIEKSREGAGGE